MTIFSDRPVLSHRLRIALATSTMLVAVPAALPILLAAAPAAAQDTVACDEALVPQPQDCRRTNGGLTVTMPLGENTEMYEGPEGADFAATGFSISIDNEHLAGAPMPADPQRDVDLAAAAAGVDVRYDGLDTRRLLNVSTADLRASYTAGSTVRFRASSNYPAWIARAEVVLRDPARPGDPVVARLPVQPNGQVDWTMPADGPADYTYALQVYDPRGRSDETRPLPLSRSAEAFPTHETAGEPLIAAGEAEDRTARRGIPVHGGVVTASGDGFVPGSTVQVMGEPVPVDGSGSFVVSRILPAGDHAVAVSGVSGGRQRELVRDVSIPKGEWFLVGIADLTVGRRFRDDLESTAPDYERSYVDGRLAFYIKGSTASGYRVTSSLDTGEGPVDEIFSRLDEKDPRNVLRRLDPEDMYPTYGDDSSSFDDAPTSGRIYLKVEKDQNSFLWGDFKADSISGRLSPGSRALYGAKVDLATEALTGDGDPRARVVLYAAQPDTLPQRDILRGTGGSVYFLKRQDINGGSETVTVQVVDPDTGRVVRTRRLSAGVDYEIDYFQGVITLAEPLNSSASGSGIIGSGPLGSYDVNLVVQYEYTPTISDVDGNSLGGRAEFNVTEGLRLGVSAMKENTANADVAADQRMAAVDLRYEFGEQSHVLVEAAQSQGPGFGRSISTDGGLTISDGGVSGAGRRARAYSADTHLSLGDLGLATPGYLTVYGESKQAGFSTLTEDVTEDQWLWGLESEIELSAQSRVAMLYERFHRDGGDRKDSGELRYSRDLNPNWTLDLAVAHLDRVVLSRPEDTGTRTDLGARLTWTRDDDLKIYGFGQGTVSRSGQVSRNNRLGLGFETRLTEKLRFAAEYSDGSLGDGGAARVTYAPTADSEVYLGYTLDPTRSEDMRELIGRDDGVIVAGTRYRYSDRFSTFAENRWDLYGSRRSLAESYGVTYTPGERWTITGGMEIGTVRDSIGGDFERRAVSLGLGYSDNDLVRGRARLEYRTEEGEGLSRDRDTWALALGYEYKVNEDWRLLFNLDSLFSDSAEDSYRDGEYLEFGLGYAYRPVLNDRLNMLLKYSYLHDLPGEDQVTASGSEDGPMQKSHVFSVDANYDLTPKLTIGGKYGYRRSKVADRGTEDFVTSSADLAILRLDWHVVHMWDILAEGRILRTRELKIDETGALLGVYRHLGNHAKIGVGYEWGKVSDDLTDLDYLGDGLFLNLVAKF